MSNPAGNVRGVVALKRALKTSWRLENELRFSAWDALPFDKDKSLHHLAEARRHLNELLNEADPIPQIVDQPPVLDPSGSNGANT